MEDLISPRYQMKLMKQVHDVIWAEFTSYDQVAFYIRKWYKNNYDPDGFNDEFWENFRIIEKEPKKIDLLATLNSMNGSTLLKIAIDLGIDTPDFIPSIPTFKNVLKSDYKAAYDTLQKAFKQIESEPDIAVGLINSVLESVIKEILKDERISNRISGGETTYKLASAILKEFNLSNKDHPKEVKTIGNSLLSICQAVETLRSERTVFHGNTDKNAILKETVFAYLVLNSVSTIVLFLDSYYKAKFPRDEKQSSKSDFDELPF